MSHSSPVVYKTPAGAVDNRMIASMRLLLASSALLIIYLDPSEPDRLVPITYTALVLYTAYSAALLILAFRRAIILRSVARWEHWADVAWYLLLISLSSGTSSIFFFFFFFSILVASFGSGFEAGLWVVVTSSALFTIIGYATAPKGTEFELNRFLLRPLYLLVFGYMMAYWGGRQITLNQRLALLREVTQLSNPRFGVDRTIGVVLDKVRAFYDADVCLFIMVDPGTGERRLRKADRNDAEIALRDEPIGDEVSSRLLALPDEYAAIYNNVSWRRLKARRYFAYDTNNGEHRLDGQEAVQKLANLLDAESLVIVPLRYGHQVAGSLFLASKSGRVFDRSDAEFILHIFDQVFPVIENIRLVDRLASDAAEQERRKIARDLHDSVIQPYIGLQIGLTAISQKMDGGCADVKGDVARLIETTGTGIADLRHYVSGLKEAGESEGNLLASVRRFAERFSEATGIAVIVEEGQGVCVNDRLAAEVFQMIAEGLSNIRRHTQSRAAVVKLTCDEGKLRLILENECGAGVADFKPRSIFDRAEAIGGLASVKLRDKSTAIFVEIPL